MDVARLGGSLAVVRVLPARQPTPRVGEEYEKDHIAVIAGAVMLAVPAIASAEVSLSKCTTHEEGI